MSMSFPYDDCLLLGISSPFLRDEKNQLFIESQTLSGLYAWRENFSAIISFSIQMDGPIPEGWVAMDLEMLEKEGIQIVPIPDTYDRRIYRREKAKISEQLLELMRKARFRTFAYGGWIGDPGEIAAATARRHGMAHAVWFDRVESQVVLAEQDGSLKQRIKSAIKSRIIARNEERAIRHADLSLLHGATVFSHFSPRAKSACQVEDVHYTASDRVDADLLSQKAQDSLQDGPLRILYCGRASAMKGGLDWIKVLSQLKALGVEFQATWVGDGEQLEDMRELADQGGLTATDLVLPGFVADADMVRQYYRQAQVMLFCHLTDESPRNLIESLHSATPLIGYHDLYSAGLVAEQGAGILVKRGNTEALAQELSRLAQHRENLAELIRRAGNSAAHLTRNEVFHHRSQIIRDNLGVQA